VSDALRDAVLALQMPPAEARAWLLCVRAFCEAHGGAPRYADLLALIARALARLDEAGGG
jgi:hypothetical protein